MCCKSCKCEGISAGKGYCVRGLCRRKQGESGDLEKYGKTEKEKKWAHGKPAGSPRKAARKVSVGGLRWSRFVWVTVVECADKI